MSETVKHAARSPWMATDGKTFRGRCTCGREGSNTTRAQAEKWTEKRIRYEAEKAAAKQEG